MSRAKKAKSKTTGARVKSEAVSTLLYSYAMLSIDEQRTFNRQLRVLRANSGMISDLASRWKSSQNASE